MNRVRRGTLRERERERERERGGAPWAEQVKHRASPTITNKVYRYPQAL
jgi:hypothetical protein